jgi:hypothetical protein
MDERVEGLCQTNKRGEQKCQSNKREASKTWGKKERNHPENLSIIARLDALILSFPSLELRSSASRACLFSLSIYLFFSFPRRQHEMH